MVKNGITTNISIRHQCITVMDSYANKCLEVIYMLTIVCFLAVMLFNHSKVPNFFDMIALQIVLFIVHKFSLLHK